MSTEVGTATSVPPSGLGMPHAPPRTLWAQQVFSAVLEIRGRLVRSAAPYEPDDELAHQVLELTDSALELIRTRPPLIGLGRLTEWWTGSRVETCWTYVHEAELTMVAMASDARLYPATMARVLSYSVRLAPDDPDRVTLEHIAGVARAQP